jgi:hypothetical protein
MRSHVSLANFGQLFHDAAFYKAQGDQDLYEYCFTKFTKLNKLQLQLRSVVKFIKVFFVMLFCKL